MQGLQDGRPREQPRRARGRDAARALGSAQRQGLADRSAAACLRCKAILCTSSALGTMTLDRRVPCDERADWSGVPVSELAFTWVVDLTGKHAFSAVVCARIRRARTPAGLHVSAFRLGVLRIRWFWRRDARVK